MKPIAAIVLAAASLVCAAGAGAQDLDLLLAHESRVVALDGVVRTTSFGERFSRRERTVWIERVMPPESASMAVRHAAATAHDHHDHGVHLATASRWITLEPSGAAKLALVDDGEHVVIDVDRPDFGNFGFDGSWGRAYHLVDPAALARMKRSGKGDPSGAQWYESRTSSGILRVLWDVRQGFAAEVRYESADGRERRTTRARQVAAPAREPWLAAARLPRKGYYDLLD